MNTNTQGTYFEGMADFEPSEQDKADLAASQNISRPAYGQGVDQARASLSRAEQREEKAVHWTTRDDLGYRTEAAANRLAIAEKYGTTLPKIVAVLKIVDHGPCDDGHPSAHCPHCGSGGRYIHYAILEDGTRIAAMSGCIKLFPQDTKYAKWSKLVAEAYKRDRDARDEKKNLAKWWDGMIGASEALWDGKIDVQRWAQAIATEESARQNWLSRNGYKKFGRR